MALFEFCAKHFPLPFSCPRLHTILYKMASTLLNVDENAPAALPPFASDAEVRYIYSWKDGAIMQRALQNIPASDVALCREVVRGAVDDLPPSLAYNRLSNRICDACRWKPSPETRLHENRLKLCSTCCQAWFCSEECREHARVHAAEPGASKHALRCGVDRATAPLDDGPMKLVFAKLGDSVG